MLHGNIGKIGKKGRSRVALCQIFIMLVLTLAGCASGEKEVENPAGDRGGKGRFIEHEVALPEMAETLLGIRKLSDGSLEAVAEGRDSENFYLLRSDHLGEDWDMTELQGLEADFYQQTAIAADGSVAFIPLAKQGIVSVELVSPDGQIRKVPVTLPKREDGEGNSIWQAEFDSEGNLIARDLRSKLLKIDLSSGSCEEPFDMQGNSVNYFGIAATAGIAVSDGGMQLFDTRGTKAENGFAGLQELLKQEKSLLRSDTDRGAPVVFGEGTDGDGIVAACYKGIYYVTRDGSTAEQLLDGALTSMGNKGAVYFGVVMADREHLLVCVSDGGETKLLRYDYDADAAAVPKQELTVYALDESAALRQAAALFQKKNPDVYVNIQIGMSGDDGVTLADALSVLSTDIMAGKGPDVLILDGMPVDSYIEKGILEDISDVVKEVDKAEGVFSGIKKASEQKGHIYAMPARFLIPLVEGDADVVSAGGTLKKLTDTAAARKERDPSVHVLPRKGAKGILRDLLYADSGVWVKEDGKLDEKALKAYLEQAKRLYDTDVYKEEDTEAVEKHYGENDGMFEGSKMGSFDTMRGVMEDAQIAMGTFAGMDEYQTLRSAQAVSGTSYCLMNHEKVSSYIPYLQVGVSAKGNRELGKKFARALLGKDANTDSNGFPVNRAAFDKQAQKCQEATEISYGISAQDGQNRSLELISLTDEDIDRITSIAESLDTPALTDRTLQELILEQGASYLRGEQSLEDAMAAMMKKINLYLAE